MVLCFTLSVLYSEPGIEVWWFCASLCRCYTANQGLKSDGFVLHSVGVTQQTRDLREHTVVGS